MPLLIRIPDGSTKVHQDGKVVELQHVSFGAYYVLDGRVYHTDADRTRYSAVHEGSVFRHGLQWYERGSGQTAKRLSPNGPFGEKEAGAVTLEPSDLVSVLRIDDCGPDG